MWKKLWKSLKPMGCFLDSLPCPHWPTMLGPCPIGGSWVTPCHLHRHQQDQCAWGHRPGCEAGLRQPQDKGNANGRTENIGARDLKVSNLNWKQIRAIVKVLSRSHNPLGKEKTCKLKAKEHFHSAIWWCTHEPPCCRHSVAKLLWGL